MLFSKIGKDTEKQAVTGPGSHLIFPESSVIKALKLCIYSDGQTYIEECDQRIKLKENSMCKKLFTEIL